MPKCTMYVFPIKFYQGLKFLLQHNKEYIDGAQLTLF